MKNIVVLLITLTLLSGCQKKENTLSPEAKAYLNEVITLLEAKTVHQKHINWKKFRADVMAHAGNAATIKDTYPSVTYAMSLLNDRHSYFSTQHQNNNETTTTPVLTDENIPDDIGYIRISGCEGDEDQIEMYRQNIIRQITTRDKQHLKGWIVDLRGNSGGHMSPMLAAIAPVLGNGTVGYFIDSKETAEPWICEKGKVLYGTTVVEDIHQFYKLKNSMPSVAVLTDRFTSGSGEGIAVAFKNRPKTRSFGESTNGTSNTNETYILSDGAALHLTVNVFADRNKKKYGGSITPDQKCVPEKAVEEAIRWIKEKQ